MSAAVLTVGHSTRTLAELIALLHLNRVTVLADVRTIPRSRRNPQFNADSLPGSLAAAGIRVVHLGALGGLRRPRPDSRNTGWRNASFRAYADHMATAEFRTGLEALLAEARVGVVAVMCAEVLPWRCHRSLIADALTVRGLAVEHLISPASRQPHRLTSFARLEGDVLVYPGEEVVG